MELKLIKSNEEILDLALMAKNIWHECYKNIISYEQIDYMTDLFLSLDSIKKTIDDGYNYYFIYQDEKLGFISYKIYDEYIYLSKFYVDNKHRGKKASSFALKHILSYGKKVRLNVNKYNENSIKIYNHFGFKIIYDEINDIGNGYIMDDYVMELLNNSDV